MGGFLIPDTYVVVAPTEDDKLIASIIWGFTIATGIFTATKAFKQTWRTWKRSRVIYAYAYMVWAEWLVSMVIGVLSWLFLYGNIAPSFWIFLVFLCLWVVQIQCICGIIINRIALLMVEKNNAVKIRWIIAGILGLINISVFIIWIPARLQISPTWIHINEIWDRIEKGLFLIIDACLHLYFIYLLRVKLISNGLHKYTPLFRYNLLMVAFSMALDIILIGSMSIGNGFIYIQFHPLVYMIKLHIEMNISSLIVKVVRATGESPSYARGTEMYGKSNNTKSGTAATNNAFSGNLTFVEAETAKSSSDAYSKGITKVMQTEVTVSRARDDDLDDHDDRVSQTSTRPLKIRPQDSPHQFV